MSLPVSAESSRWETNTGGIALVVLNASDKAHVD